MVAIQKMICLFLSMAQRALSRRVMTACMLSTLTLGATAVQAQDDDFGQTPYVPTPQSVVDRMLQVAKVTASDYVIDLGSGDGRMVITAALEYGARGFGVDLDRRLVDRANMLATKAGVSDRAVFYERDLFDTDMTEATVVTIYLLPEVNLMARPKLLSTLKPGTRVVAHDYDMGEWIPDDKMVLDVPDKPVGREKKSNVFFWVIPGNAAGKWHWTLPVGGKDLPFDAVVTQNFQMIKGSVDTAGASQPLADAKLRGEDIAFNAADSSGTRYAFSGHISGDTIHGSVRVSSATAMRELTWEATRTEVGTPAHLLLKKPDLLELKKQMEPH